MGIADDVLQQEPHLASHQGDQVKRRRLRWRARRGLLENDLVLVRFFDRYEARLSDDDVQGLDELLDLSDNDLMDLIFCRASAEKEASLPEQARRVLALVRAV
jgi:antitoxin CptB